MKKAATTAAANKFQIIPVSDVENSFDKMHKKAISSCRQIEIYAEGRWVGGCEGALEVRGAWYCSDSWVNKKWIYIHIHILI